MDINNLSDELKAKARACTTPEDLLALAHAEGIELTEEQLSSLSGGSDWYDCPLAEYNPCPDDFC